MVQKKNKFMLYNSLGMVALIYVIYFITLSGKMDMHGMHSGQASDDVVLKYILLVLPVILLIVTTIIYLRNHIHKYIPHLVSIVCSFASIAIVVAGNGAVEFHFSIFMAIALIAYYEQISIIVTMTLIFVVEHVAGLLVIPELIFGASEYPFLMVLVHAVFLVLTSTMTIIQVISKRRLTNELEEGKQLQQRIIENTIAELSKSTEAINESVASLEMSVNQTIQSSERITGNINNIEQETVTQAEKIRVNTISIEEVAVGVDRIAQMSGQVAESTESMLQRIIEGNNSVLKAENQISNVSHASQEVYQSFTELVEKTNEISNMAIVIRDIAEQTNLLSLNASIEAARAGEMGRGFVVVAQQVKKLANQSSTSANEITELIDTVQARTMRTLGSMESSTEEVTKSVEDMVELKHIFNTIMMASESISEQMTESATTTEQMSTMTDQVNVTIDEISVTVDASVKEIKEMSLELNDQQHNIETIMNSIDKLQIQIVNLNEIVVRLNN
ncbi:methyl-accepting chemotaxis protein [Paenibacillus sp. CMAA1364]